MITTAKRLFVIFAQRDGWTYAEATQELTFLLSCNDVKYVRDYYLSTCRIGATKRLNRAGKLAVWSTWENAQNHAAFELECV